MSFAAFVTRMQPRCAVAESTLPCSRPLQTCSAHFTASALEVTSKHTPPVARFAVVQELIDQLYQALVLDQRIIISEPEVVADADADDPFMYAVVLLPELPGLGPSARCASPSGELPLKKAVQYQKEGKLILQYASLRLLKSAEFCGDGPCHGSGIECAMQMAHDPVKIHSGAGILVLNTGHVACALPRRRHPNCSGVSARACSKLIVQSCTCVRWHA